MKSRPNELKKDITTQLTNNMNNSRKEDIHNTHDPNTETHMKTT